MTEATPTPDPLERPVFDSHCHLDIALDGDAVAAEDALAAAQAVNVVAIGQIGTDVVSSQWSAAIGKQYEDILAFVALHPNEAPRIALAEGAGALEAAYAQIAELVALPHVCGVGETGLDHYRTDESGRRAQEESFRRHIRWAKEFDKPLSVHDRDAHADVVRVLEDEGPPNTVILHCFSGDAELAIYCAAKGWFLSYSGNVTFKNAPDRRAALSATPRDRVLVETDAPFLAPVPHRGRPNASYVMPLTVRAMASELDLSEAEMCDLLMANSKAALRIG